MAVLYNLSYEAHELYGITARQISRRTTWEASMASKTLTIAGGVGNIVLGLLSLAFCVSLGWLELHGKKVDGGSLLAVMAGMILLTFASDYIMVARKADNVPHLFGFRKGREYMGRCLQVTGVCMMLGGLSGGFVQIFRAFGMI
jgi:hypothetical protein